MRSGFAGMPSKRLAALFNELLAGGSVSAAWPLDDGARRIQATPEAGQQSAARWEVIGTA